MHKTTIIALVSAVAAGLVIATVYVFYDQTSSNTVVEQPPAVMHPTPAKRASNANPLTVATYEQFRMWVTRYPIPCNEIIYAKPEPEHIHYDFCIDLIIDRVAEGTNIRLSKEDVLDSKAKAHWLKTMGG